MVSRMMFKKEGVVISARHFHFLDISQKRAPDVRAKCPNFLPVVEGCKVRLSDDPEPFPGAKFACPGDWVERLTSVKNFPVYFPSGPSRLAFPYMGAQNCLMLVLGVKNKYKY